MKRIVTTAIAGIIMLALTVTGCSRESIEPAVSPSEFNSTSSPVPAATSPLTPDNTDSILQNDIPLSVIEPADAAEINTDTITVKGQTVQGATVSVNDAAGIADADGNFEVSITLEQGINAIDVIATDDSGNQGEMLILVNVIL